MRVIIEAREFGGIHRVERDTASDNWLDEKRNNAERRQGIIDAANGLLRSLNLDEIVESAS
ncbi:hypothetical protein AB4Z38_06980 [Arthrobacter sp. 2RAF6]|uniref:hypothetical protein n=1 Tax=Arthrobacter sp. 2RAF6 TaxID=3233002 RepID=UPI003F90F47C